MLEYTFNQEVLTVKPYWEKYPKITNLNGNMNCMYQGFCRDTFRGSKFHVFLRVLRVWYFWNYEVEFVNENLGARIFLGLLFPILFFVPLRHIIVIRDHIWCQSFMVSGSSTLPCTIKVLKSMLVWSQSFMFLVLTQQHYHAQPRLGGLCTAPGSRTLK